MSYRYRQTPDKYKGAVMMATFVGERDELERFEGLVERVRPQAAGRPERDAGTSRLSRPLAAHRQSPLRLRSTGRFPPASTPEQLAEIRGELLEILQRVADHDPARPLDSVEAALLGLEAIRHVVRDALDQQTARRRRRARAPARPAGGASARRPQGSRRTAWHQRSFDPAHPREPHPR